MSFRKRNTVISAAPAASGAPQQSQQRQLAPGLRPSPLDGRLTTSTGTASLDALLAGHAGLALGTSLLIEEQGTTDFAGTVLRYYAAEGLVQGHHVHLLGMSEAWKHDLPGVSETASASTGAAPVAPSPEDRMKIAWRYETLGAPRRSPGLPLREREGSAATSSAVFCHSFDLSKRLGSSSMKGTFYASPSSRPLDLSFEAKRTPSPLKVFIRELQKRLATSPPASIHRVVIPGFLSPSHYASDSCRPSEALQFLHSLRALLRQYSGRLTAMLSLPASLHPRSAGLVRWMELLCDGTIELVPLPPTAGAAAGPASSGQADSKGNADKAQGMVRVHTLPVYHEKGGGGAGANHFRENLSFSLSSSRGLVITPYSLPPLEEEDHKEKSPASTVKDGIDF